MSYPQGWQNIASERHRVRGQEAVLPLIEQIHAQAYETKVGDDYAYWLGPEDQPRLIGIAWKSEDSDSWWYCCMSERAVESGMLCTLIHESRDAGARKLPPDENYRNRVVPGLIPGFTALITSVELAQITKTASKAQQAPARRSVARPAPRPRPAPVRPIRPAPASPAAVTRRVYQQRGQWYAWVETATRAREFGPFASRAEADAALR